MPLAKKQRLYDGDNPAIGVGKFKMQSRDRFLQADELPQFFGALEKEPDDDMRDFTSATCTMERRAEPPDQRPFFVHC
jgi:hypothetical protein